MNACLLQILDGMPITDEDSKYPRCADCEARHKEGSEIIAHTYLDRKWHVETVYCADCYLQTEVSFTEDLEEAIVEASIATRSDCATQSNYYILHTRGGYGVLRHSEDKDGKTETDTDGAYATHKEDNR